MNEPIELLRILPPEGTLFKQCTLCEVPFVYDGTSENCLFCELNKIES